MAVRAGTSRVTQPADAAFHVSDVQARKVIEYAFADHVHKRDLQLKREGRDVSFRLLPKEAETE
jgi:hypothetical protein